MPELDMERSPAVVYLDQLHWISLARANSGHAQGSVYIPVWDYLRQAVLDRKAVFPLSAMHYEELQANQNFRQRAAVASVMSLLSGHKTVSGIGPIRTAELEQALHRRFGKPTEPTRVKPFGWGMHFAFGEPGARLRITGPPEAIAEFAERFGGMEAFKRWEWEMAFLFEDLILCGPGDDEIDILRRDYGYAPEMFEQVVQSRVKREQDLADRLKTEDDLRRRLDDVVAARTLYWEVAYLFPDVLPTAGISIEELFGHGKDWITAFCEDMPIVAVILALAKANHKVAADRTWRKNDIHDIDALSTAVPYCDIVVTEKHFCEQARRTQLADRFSTVVMRKLEELPEAIEAWHKSK